MKQSGHLNPSEETRTGCRVTSKYGRTPPNKHGGVGREQQHLVVYGGTYGCVKSFSYLLGTLDGYGGADIAATATIRS